MRHLPFLSNAWNYLTSPIFPSTSLAIRDNYLALIKLQYRQKVFEPRNLGVLKLPAGLLRAGFNELNIADVPTFKEQLKKTLKLAGIAELKTLSVTLPNKSSRSMVVSFDALPEKRAEMGQMIEWKVERTFGQKFSDLRVNYTRLTDIDGRPQWLVSAAHEKVIAQFETCFEELGWEVGLIVPQHMGEAQWLIRSRIDEDQAVVSLNDNGFDAVIVRRGQPFMVRNVDCPVAERENEFFRLMVFYRDRLQPADPQLAINRLLTIGNAAEQRRYHDILCSALEKKVVSLAPKQLGLRIDPNAPFVNFAAAGGLATMAWS
ncbi:MAG: hypothetical protein L0220_05505 [Acidobacteria bacterium]|nr:hypothetical protein [Acidobacteriota bacterium]